MKYFSPLWYIEAMKEIQDLLDYVEELHQKDAIHVRRGFKLSQATALDASNHLLEEAIELQAEVIQNQEFGYTDDMLDEASDVLVCYLHLLRRKCMPLSKVAEHAKEKLQRAFTTDPSKVTAIKPGVTRKGRAK